MASLIELTQWEESIYQIETTDNVVGGNDGISNRQGKQLANRTAYLKKQVELKAPIASPTFTGVPAVPTAAADTSTTQVASTAFVVGQAATVAPVVDGVAAIGTSKKFARQDHVHPIDTTRAPIASPTFTGVPAVPTAAADTSTTQVASTAFVVGQAATVAPVVDGVAAVGTSTKFARQDHVHPIDTTRAPIASPTFTGVPAVPTAAADTSTTQVASTAFVIGQAAKVAPVVDGVAAVGTSTKFARQDHVHPIDTTRAPIASPTFTGVPAVPTAATDTNTTQAASTAFVQAQIAAGNLASKTSNGYQKLPSGLIIQWGSAGTSTVGIVNNFPITFPNACLIVTGNTSNTGSIYPVACVINSTSQFTATVSQLSPAIYYIAIGY